MNELTSSHLGYCESMLQLCVDNSLPQIFHLVYEIALMFVVNHDNKPCTSRTVVICKVSVLKFKNLEIKLHYSYLR